MARLSEIAFDTSTNPPRIFDMATLLFCPHSDTVELFSGLVKWTGTRLQIRLTAYVNWSARGVTRRFTITAVTAISNADAEHCASRLFCVSTTLVHKLNRTDLQQVDPVMRCERSRGNTCSETRVQFVCCEQTLAATGDGR